MASPDTYAHESNDGPTGPGHLIDCKISIGTGLRVPASILPYEVQTILEEWNEG